MVPTQRMLAEAPTKSQIKSAQPSGRILLVVDTLPAALSIPQ
jgi:hypothetical protein